MICILYAPFRFTLDFMRTDDKTYLGLTTAHYATMVLLSIGIYLAFIRRTRPEDLEWAKDSERIARERQEAEARKAAAARAT
jgi:phosphatidylglycerol:prolipoprotein diacylglycerol transferase